MWHPPLPHTPPLSSKPTASSPYISRVDYKGRFDKGAFWVSDNHIIILLKSVLIVSKLLVRVSNPCDLGRGGIFEQTHLALKLCSMNGEEGRTQATGTPLYAKWLWLPVQAR